MRTLRLVCLAVCTLVFLTGCYESTVPISDPDAATLDPALQGTWEPAEIDEDARFWVTAFNEREYLIEMCCDEDVEVDGREGDGRVFMRAFLSDVDGTRFMNLQILGAPPEEQQAFFFYRVEQEGDDVLALHPIADAALEAAAPATSEALFELVRTNGADPAFYTADVLRLRRVER